MTDEMPLRLRPQFSVIVHGPDDVELRQGVWNPVSVTLRDEANEGRLARLVTRLDGSLTVGDLSAQQRIPREQVERLVDRLLELDVLEMGPSSAMDAYLSAAAPWRIDDTVKPDQPLLLLAEGELADGIRDAVSPVLGSRPITVAEAGDPARAVLEDPDTSWLGDGLATEERLAPFEEWRSSVVVAPFVTIDPVRALILNRAALRYGIRWVHGALDGPFVLVGPSFLPGESPCYECLETRIFLNMREGASYQRYKAALAESAVRLGSPPLFAPLTSMLTSHLALETLNLLLTGSTFTVGKMLVIHIPTMEFSFPEVLRVPGCKGCGSVAERDGDVLYYDPPLVAREEA